MFFFPKCPHPLQKHLLEFFSLLTHQSQTNNHSEAGGTFPEVYLNRFGTNCSTVGCFRWTGRTMCTIHTVSYGFSSQTENIKPIHLHSAHLPPPLPQYSAGGSYQRAWWGAVSSQLITYSQQACCQKHVHPEQPYLPKNIFQPLQSHTCDLNLQATSNNYRRLQGQGVRQA